MTTPDPTVGRSPARACGSDPCPWRATPPSRSTINISRLPTHRSSVRLPSSSRGRCHDTSSVPTARSPFCPLDLALEVGIRANTADPLGKRVHLVRALERLVHDRIVVRLDDRVLGVSCRVPPLGHGRLERLPAAVRRRHEEILAAVAVLNVSPPTDGNEDRDPSFPDGSRVHREPIIKRWCSSRNAPSKPTS